MHKLVVSALIYFCLIGKNSMVYFLFKVVKLRQLMLKIYVLKKLFYVNLLKFLKICTFFSLEKLLLKDVFKY